MYREVGKLLSTFGLLMIFAIPAFAGSEVELSCDGFHSMGGTNMAAQKYAEKVSLRIVEGGKFSVTFGGRQDLSIKTCDSSGGNCKILDDFGSGETHCESDNCQYSTETGMYTVSISIRSRPGYFEQLRVNLDGGLVSYSGGGLDGGWRFQGHCEKIER